MSTESPPPEVEEPLEPLAEATALRAALLEARRRFGRLTAALRPYRQPLRELVEACTGCRLPRLRPPEEP